MQTAILVVVAYLIGSITTAVLVARALRLPDPRSLGSGNPGATNVLRMAGKKAAALTLLGDLLKGAIPVWLARGLGLDGWDLAAVALAAFLGHLFPVFFGFRGGKGVATGLGVYLALSVPLALALAAVWLTVALLFRISSLAALSAAVSAPLLSHWLLPGAPYLTLAMVLALLLLWRHQGNIQRILAGTEKRIGEKA
ncbi:MAG: glycerol-3-phosphate 1-O-acyltransferase PlsY [Pseudomonadota bacterium]|uniref:glycerol-3-phosphate 1-O-acyltransferase PlsY n=1 Tax=Thermithiobacillus tepidarius TaxID=929 RepID=UPI0004251A7A|nr:glycerol-3-phosphate 1-O-acyltransferase PlsY [Thermithiobacillus tepidarius]